MSLASLQMPLGVPGYQYDSAAQMAEALAQRIAETLRQALGERGRALVLVSGGAQPRRPVRTPGARAAALEAGAGEPGR